MVSGEGLAMPYTRHAVRELKLSVPSPLQGGEIAFDHVANALTNHIDLMKPQTRKILGEFPSSITRRVAYPDSMEQRLLAPSASSSGYAFVPCIITLSLSSMSHSSELLNLK